MNIHDNVSEEDRPSLATSSTLTPFPQTDTIVVSPSSLSMRPSKRPKRDSHLPTRLISEPLQSEASQSTKWKKRRSPERTFQRPTKLLGIRPKPLSPTTSIEGSQTSTANVTSSPSPKLGSGSSASSIASRSMLKETNVAELSSQLQRIAQSQVTSKEESEMSSPPQLKGKDKERAIILPIGGYSPLEQTPSRESPQNIAVTKGKGRELEVVSQVDLCETVQANDAKMPQGTDVEAAVDPVLRKCGDAVQD